MRSSLSAAALLAALTTPLAAQDSAEHADHAVQGGGAVPAGWTIRADKGDAKDANSRVHGRGPSPHARPRDHPLSRRHRRQRPLSHPRHVYPDQAVQARGGLRALRRGQALDGAGTEVPLLSDPPGRELPDQAARRGQDQRRVEGLGPERAVKQADAKGSATNLLEVDNKRDPSKLVFLVNGQEGLQYRREGHGAGRDRRDPGEPQPRSSTSKASTCTAERRCDSARRGCQETHQLDLHVRRGGDRGEIVGEGAGHRLELVGLRARGDAQPVHLTGDASWP